MLNIFRYRLRTFVLIHTVTSKAQFTGVAINIVTQE
jgi:hypothetical protein